MKKIDLRVQKTLIGIRSAYLEIASTKPIDRITVKDICDKAMINKATYYAHYDNIFHLTDALENELIINLTNNADFLSLLIENPTQFMLNILTVYENNPLADMLMKSSRKLIFMEKFFDIAKKSIYNEHPALKKIEGFDVTISFIFYGLLGVSAETRSKFEDKNIMAARLGKAISSIYNDSLNFKTR